MSQDDLIERIARLIYDADALRPRLTWERLTPLTQGEYRKEARAALSAMPSREDLLREALEALDRIVDFHIGDCPMTMEEIDFAKNINWQIRKTARAAADKIRAALTQEKQT